MSFFPRAMLTYLARCRGSMARVANWVNCGIGIEAAPRGSRESGRTTIEFSHWYRVLALDQYYQRRLVALALDRVGPFKPSQSMRASLMLVAVFAPVLANAQAKAPPPSEFNADLGFVSVSGNTSVTTLSLGE